MTNLPPLAPTLTSVSPYDTTTSREDNAAAATEPKDVKATELSEEQTEEQKEMSSTAEIGNSSERGERDLEIDDDEETRGIPPADGGRHAWLFLADCFMFEALVWGFPFAFGVFQPYYSTHLPFSKHAGGVATIGTCSTGVIYLFAPVSLYVLEAFPSIRRMCSVVGLVLMIISLIAASFASQVWHLIITQGVLYAIGASLMYSPTMFYLDEWFIKRKGFAFGVMWSGLRNHARIYALILGVLCTPLIYFVKPRLPRNRARKRVQRQRLSHAFLRSRKFWALQTASILEGLGFFIPSIYLASYASNFLRLSSTSSVLILAILNSFSVLGAISMGHLCDKLHVRTVILISTCGSVLSVFLLWGFASSLTILVIFAGAYGVFAGGISAIWTGMMHLIQIEFASLGPEDAPKMGTLLGLFSAGRGIGAVCSGPISQAPLSRMHGNGLGHGTKFGYGSDYGVLIVFTGITALCGMACLRSRRAK